MLSAAQVVLVPGRMLAAEPGHPDIQMVSEEDLKMVEDAMMGECQCSAV